ncbi:hypothetical protein DOY81_008393, partial [Sarcophaga bullata]
KKGKKNKGTVISLQSFLSNGDVPVGTTQVAKNIRNVDGEDSDEGGNVLTVVCQLPTAPRANRIFDDNAIPHKAPYVVYLTNLPFDVKEDDVYDYFNTYQVKSIRLPREDGETGRVRGFGYVEFETRDDLIQSLSIPDPTIKGRRIRIDLSNENEQNTRQRGGRRGYESLSGNINDRDSTNWRCDNIKRKESSMFGNLNRDRKALSDDNKSAGSWRIRDSSSLIESSKFEQVHDREFVDDNKFVERPKLILKPRTLPLPDVKLQADIEHKDAETSDLKMDTIAKDLEIEERLAEVRLHKAIKKDDLDQNELNIGKNDPGVNVDRSWRRHQACDEISNRSEDKKIFRSDLRRDNRNKLQDKTERYDKAIPKDGKRKEIIKNRREIKSDKHASRNIQNLQNENDLQSSNKYSGLDEVSD